MIDRASIEELKSKNRYCRNSIPTYIRTWRIELVLNL